MGNSVALGCDNLGKASQSDYIEEFHVEAIVRRAREDNQACAKHDEVHPYHGPLLVSESDFRFNG
jgi:hypothetical protein